jgi:signal transduction histidine kinase
MPNALSPDFRVLFQQCSGSYVVLDPHFFILAATDNYVRLTMTQRENIVGQHFFDAFPDSPDDPSAVGVRNLRSSLERTLRDRVPDTMAVQRFNIRGPNDQAEERYCRVVNTPILDAQNRVKYIVSEFILRGGSGRVADSLAARVGLETEILLRSQELETINEQLKLANEELALRTTQLNDALQTMETFTYSIAHDLRGPLRAMLAFSALVVEESSGSLEDRTKDYLSRINEAARRMDRLVGDLLVYGRLSHVEATSVPISLDQALTNVLEDLRAEIHTRSGQIEIRRPLPIIMGSPVLLNHVLINLLDNALKFMPADRHPCITVHSSRTEGGVRLFITDNGIGIPREYHTKIFDLFTRLHKPSEYSGTGIGLALVKRAMDRMLGKVGVESTHGQGSCFWLEFRAAK